MTNPESESGAAAEIISRQHTARAVAAAPTSPLNVSIDSVRSVLERSDAVGDKARIVSAPGRGLSFGLDHGGRNNRRFSTRGGTMQTAGAESKVDITGLEDVRVRSAVAFSDVRRNEWLNTGGASSTSGLLDRCVNDGSNDSDTRFDQEARQTESTAKSCIRSLGAAPVVPKEDGKNLATKSNGLEESCTTSVVARKQNKTVVELMDVDNEASGDEHPAKVTDTDVDNSGGSASSSEYECSIENGSFCGKHKRLSACGQTTPGDGWTENGVDESKQEHEEILREAAREHVASLEREAVAIRNGTHPDMVDAVVAYNMQDSQRQGAIHAFYDRQAELAKEGCRTRLSMIDGDYEAALEQSKYVNKRGSKKRRLTNQIGGWIGSWSRPNPSLMTTRQTRGQTRGSGEKPVFGKDALDQALAKSKTAHGNAGGFKEEVYKHHVERLSRDDVMVDLDILRSDNSQITGRKRSRFLDDKKETILSNVRYVSGGGANSGGGDAGATVGAGSGGGDDLSSVVKGKVPVKSSSCRQVDSRGDDWSPVPPKEKEKANRDSDGTIAAARKSGLRTRRAGASPSASYPQVQQSESLTRSAKRRSAEALDQAMGVDGGDGAVAGAEAGAGSDGGDVAGAGRGASGGASGRVSDGIRGGGGESSTGERRGRGSKKARTGKGPASNR